MKTYFQYWSPAKRYACFFLPQPKKEKKTKKDKDRDKPKYKEKENILPILVPSKEVCVLVLSPNKGRVKPWQIFRQSQIGEGPASF